MVEIELGSVLLDTVQCNYCFGFHYCIVGHAVAVVRTELVLDGPVVDVDVAVDEHMMLPLDLPARLARQREDFPRNLGRCSEDRKIHLRSRCRCPIHSFSVLIGIVVVGVVVVVVRLRAVAVLVQLANDHRGLGIYIEKR